MTDDYGAEIAELGAIVGRDEGAFSRWFARNEIALKQSLRSFARVVDVEAVVQDTAVLVWERASRIVPDGRPAFLLRWGITVALNKARNEARRAGRQVPLDVAVTDRAAIARARRDADPMLRIRIARCRRQLSDGLGGHSSSASPTSVNDRIASSPRR